MNTDNLCTVIEIGRCTLCGIERSELLTKLTEKGFQTLVDACVKHGDDSLRQFLLSQQSAGYTLSVHHLCRWRFTDPRNISKLRLDIKILLCWMPSTAYVTEWLECSCEKETMLPLNLCPDDVDCFETMYSLKHLKHKLVVDRYGDSHCIRWNQWEEKHCLFPGYMLLSCQWEMAQWSSGQ